MRGGDAPARAARESVRGAEVVSLAIDPPCYGRMI
jgi:hypothetical protein